MLVAMRTVTCTFLLAFSGCVTLPKADKVAAFGEATAASSEIFESSLRTNRMIAVRTGQQRQAAAYVSGQPFQLSEAEIDGAIIVEAPQQVAALNVLNDYGKALVLAADQGVVDELEEASVKLGEAAGGVVLAASPLAAPIAAPGLKLASRLLGLGLGNAYAGEIQSIISARDPDVQKVTVKLIEDLDGVVGLIEIQVKNFEAKRQDALIAIRIDKRVDRLRLYEEYMSSRADLDAVLAKQAALANYRSVLEKMAAAHAALAANRPDRATLVKNFVAATNDLADLLEAVRTYQGA